MSSFPASFPPAIQSLAPAYATAGGITFTLTVNGSNFVSGAAILWNGVSQTTTLVSANQLTCSISSTLIAAAGAVNITVLSNGNYSQPIAFGITAGPNPIDICTLGEVLSWLSSNGAPGPNGGDYNNIQFAITAAGLEWMLRTGNGPSDGITNPTASPLNTPVAFNEFYDGSGSAEQFLRHWPIVNVTLLQINSVQIPQSTGWGSMGWVIAPHQRSIILRNGSNNASTPPGANLANYYWWDQLFTKGGPGNRLNVNVQYTAGYSATPFDISELCVEMVAAVYRRRDFIEQASQAMAQGAGTVRYRDWELSPRILKCMRRYARLAAV